MRIEEFLFIQKESLRLLCLLAYQIDLKNNTIIGELDAIKKILDIIVHFNERERYDYHDINMIQYFWKILISLTGK